MSSVMTTNITINGAGGRMGRALVQVCCASEHTTLLAALARATADCCGQDAGTVAGIDKQHLAVISDRSAIPQQPYVWVDFTLPDGVLDALAFCTQESVPMVIGTTGLNSTQKDLIEDASHTIPIVFAPNMSVGVNLCLSILKTAARTLGQEYDVEIVEAHHKNKLDAPSGTALRMGEVVAEALDVDLADNAEYVRHGNLGTRKKGAIGFQSVRAGDIVGEHTVTFAGVGERIEIAHKASSRMTFAQGAMRAADWLSEQPAGLYDMQDVLRLKT